MAGAALGSLAARYGYWLGLDTEAMLEDREEVAEDIRAMQLLVRMERDRPPSWRSALSLAAKGAAAICLDPRADPGGPWYEAVAAYCAGHIRKVTRRGRGAQWEATAALPGIGLADGDTQLRALLPGRVTELDNRVAKLQVGGTDVEVDAPAVAPAQPDRVLQLWLPPKPAMTMGKAMAQAGHAGMIAAALLATGDPDALEAWRAADLPVHVYGRNPEFSDLAGRLADPAGSWRAERLLAVRDAGFTEVDPGTITVIARAPR